MPDTASKKIGATLRDLRLATGKSQARVAHEIGVSRSTVTQMELGNRSVRAQDLSSLCRAYGCSPAGLLAAPMKEADREDAVLVAVTRDGQTFLGRQRIDDARCSRARGVRGDPARSTLF